MFVYKFLKITALQYFKKLQEPNKPHRRLLSEPNNTLVANF